MDDFLQQRDQLIREDRALRVDSTRPHELTPFEIEADKIVREIRASEAKSVWSPNNQSLYGLPESSHIFPGMEFLTARKIILQTRLFHIISKMPKGGLLHAHLDATVNVRHLLRLALKHPSIHVRVNGELTTTSIKTLLPDFQALQSSQFTSSNSLTHESYEHGTWVSLQHARKHFHPDLGGPEGFDSWFVDSMMIKPEEAYGTHNTTEKIWEKFKSTFAVSSNLIRFLPIWSEYVREFLLSSIEDGISYVEARINFLFKYMFGEDGIENIPHREWLLAFDRILNEVKVELIRRKNPKAFVGSRIIYTTIREVTPDELEWYLDDCLALKQEFPHLIAGFDLVGHEDSLRPLIDYIKPLQKFVERQKELQIDIPFYFHAGETLGDGTAADMNLYDAILLGTKRIGHGFSLIKHPRLMELCKERKIAVEVCPISNEILRLTSSMPMHPLPALINHGVPVALCSDDPAVFGNMGLSYDFFQVIVASEVTGLITLGELARDSIRYSALDSEEKERALSLWNEEWHQFIQWVVQEQGAAIHALRN